MSRRWAKHQPYDGIDPADWTAPVGVTDDEWREAVRAFVLSLGAALLVIASWHLLRLALGVGI